MKFYVTVNRPFHIRVSAVCKQKQCECPFRSLFSKSSYHIVTSQLIYNANEFAGFHITQAFTKKCFWNRSPVSPTFLSNFYFFTRWSFMFFISYKKFFSFLRYSYFCNFFPPFPHFPGTKEQMEVEEFLMSWIGFHKFGDAIFGITQKLLYITSSNLVR